MNPITGLVSQRSLDAALLVMGGSLVVVALASRVGEEHLAAPSGVVP